MKRAGSKVKTLEALLPIVDRLKRQGKKIVTTNGCYDIMHAGHLDSLEWASEQGDVLIVGVNTDSSVRENKGNHRPILPETERAHLVAGLGAVDYVFLFSEKSPTEWIDMLKPHVHVKGPGSEHSPAFDPEKDVVEKNGGQVRVAPRVFNRSTTSIIEKVLSIHH